MKRGVAKSATTRAIKALNKEFRKANRMDYEFVIQTLPNIQDHVRNVESITELILETIPFSFEKSGAREYRNTLLKELEEIIDKVGISFSKYPPPGSML